MADQLVERIVPADVFTQLEQLARQIKQRAGMQSAGLLERLLLRAQAVGKKEDRFGSDSALALQRRKLLSHGIDRRFAANAAAR